MSVISASEPATQQNARIRVAALTDRTLIQVVAALFVLPNLIFAVGLKPLPAALLVTGGLAAFLMTLPGLRRGGLLDDPIRPRQLAAALAVATVILILGGETHLVRPNADWLIRDAVLADVTRGPLPLGYRVGGAEYLLRAPIGMYMTPGLIGQWLGLHAAHLALLAQNALMFGVILYVLVRLAGSWWPIAVMLAWGGMGVLWLVVEGEARGDFSRLLNYREPMDMWNYVYQYSSTVTQWFWVPNHAIPAWWLALLLMLNRRGEVDAPTVGLAVAAGMLWSPLAIVPAALYLIYLALTAPRETLGPTRTWAALLVASAFVPVASYLTIAAGSIEHNLPYQREYFLFFYIPFVVLNLACAAFAAWRWRDLEPTLRTPFVLGVALLTVLPFFCFGPGNDLVMRGSMTALVVITFCFGQAVVSAVRARALSAVIGVTIVVIGAASPAVEILRPFLMRNYGISDCSLIEGSTAAEDGSVPTNYAALMRYVPDWLTGPPRRFFDEERDTNCKPGPRRPG